ncbi:MAG: TnpV protein [Lachnospirales bacterium]
MEYEEREGILYPKIKFSKEEKYEGKQLGKYGRMAQKYLKENYKFKYNELLMSGELLPMLHKIEQQANDYLDELTKEFLEKEPIKNPNNFWETAQHKLQIKRQAEEIILNEIIYKKFD